MDEQALERLMMDQAMGALDADTEQLLAHHLARDPTAARQAEEYRQVVRLARRVLRAGDAEPVLPRLQTARLQCMVSRRRQRRYLTAASAIAAMLLIGATLFSVATRTSPPQLMSGNSAMPIAAGSSASPPVSQETSAGAFWSARRLYTQTSRGAPQWTLVWNSPAYEPRVP